MMKALVANGRTVELRNLPKPSIKHPGDVLLKVRAAGICKTDIAVALGHIDGPANQAFGHEFSGEVLAVGSEVSSLVIGQRVAVDPLIHCKTCEFCRSGEKHLCGDTRLMGVHQPGAFCEQLCLPASRCYPIQNHISDKLAAYAEPLAAMLSVRQVGLNPDMQVAVVGSDRIAELCRFILRQAGFNINKLSKLNKIKLDAIIHCTSDQAIPLNVLKPGGTLVLKTRIPLALNLNSAEIVRQRIRIVGANYAKFSDAINYLHQHGQALQNFLGRSFRLEDYALAFNEPNDKKYFFDLCAV